jgi:hypothetical protein
MIEATALPAAWQVRFRAGDSEGRADTVKDGTGGSAGMRPHELPAVMERIERSPVRATLSQQLIFEPA